VVLIYVHWFLLRSGWHAQLKEGREMMFEEERGSCLSEMRTSLLLLLPLCLSIVTS
jgi:hypothetical protein